MPQYRFSARDHDGSLVRDTLRAGSESSARRILMERYAALLSLETSEELVIRHRKVPRKDVAVWLRQFATLINAGISLVQSLELSHNGENPDLTQAVEIAASEVVSGIPLSTALGRSTSLLHKNEIALVRAGENSGRLPQILLRLSDALEREVRWRQKLSSAATYPVFILLFGVALFWLFITWVLPAMTAVLKQLGVELPLITRITITISDFFSNTLNVALSLLFLGGAIALLRLGWRQYHQWLAPLVYNLLERIPYLGRVLARLDQVKLLSSLSGMLSAGLPINLIIELLLPVPNHPLRKHALKRAYEEILKGESIGTSFENAQIFESMVVHILIAGEESGQLDTLSGHASELLETDLERDTETLISVMEPLMMVIIGGIAFFFIVAAFLPLVQVLGSFI